MRIIAGEWRGRAIEAPAGAATRPTADRARETLFSMLASRVGSFEELQVADLFAGTGALGLEALSRGAAGATFVEHDSKAVVALRRNVETLGAQDRARIIAASALNLPKSSPFDLIFADPPYAPGAGSEVVRSILASGWLSKGGWLSVETSRGDMVDPAELALDTTREVGRTRLTLLRRP